MNEMQQQAAGIRPMATTIAAVTAGAIAVSWGLNYLLLFADNLSAFSRAAITATLLPILLVVPLMIFGLWQREQARRARQASIMAQGRDPASGYIGQTMLSAIVAERRKATPLTDGPVSGAFLMIEADGLRKINARFGPEWAASALTLVADTIRRSVRATDQVGRLQTGEFGIFLPHVSENDAEQVGRRIVDEVAAIYFAPQGIESVIGVRVAGIVFDHQLEFAEMVRHTARRLADMPAEESPAMLPLETLSSEQSTQ